jgi:NTE family protein
MAQKTKIGLALGGGGARGLAHVGVLKALEEEKIPIHAIAGTSMGAIVGGAYVQYRDSRKLISIVHQLIDKFDLQTGWMDVLRHQYEKEQRREGLLKELSYYVRSRLIFVVGASRISLESEKKLLEPLQAAIRDEPIEKAGLSFAAVTVDLVSGKEVVITKGSMLDAVYASASIEGVFPPLKTAGRLLSDGGASSLVPVDAARGLGADFIVGVDIPLTIREETKFASGIEIVLRADDITRDKLNRLLLEKCDVVITPDVGSIHWADFGRVDECIQKGYEAAKSKAAQIREKTKGEVSVWKSLRRSLGQAITGKGV